MPNLGGLGGPGYGRGFGIPGGPSRGSEQERDITLLRGFGLPPSGVPVTILKPGLAKATTPSKEKEKRKIRKRKVTPSTTLTSPLGLTGLPPIVRPTLLGG